MGLLEVWLLPWRPQVLLSFHITADLRVDVGDDLMCSRSYLAVHSVDDTLEAIAGVEILLGEIHSHCLLFQADLIFEILHKILHPV